MVLGKSLSVTKVEQRLFAGGGKGEDWQGGYKSWGSRHQGRKLRAKLKVTRVAEFHVLLYSNQSILDCKSLFTTILRILAISHGVSI